MKDISKKTILLPLVISIGVASLFLVFDEIIDNYKDNQNAEKELSNYKTQQRFEEYIDEGRVDVETDMSLNKDGYQIIERTLDKSETTDSVIISDSYKIEKHNENGTLVDSREG